jgi:hypothetical protein
MSPAKHLLRHHRLTHLAPWASAPVFVLVAALLAPIPAQAQWKWRDASGRLQHSDMPPPPSVPDKDILQRPGAAVAPNTPKPPPAAAAASGALPTAKPASATPKTALDTEVEQRRKAEEQARMARKKADDERQAGQRLDNCQRAKEAVATLQSGQRIARINAKGEREVLGDEQRAEETRRAQAVVAQDCR